jgi:hypothetical protein
MKGVVYISSRSIRPNLPGVVLRDSLLSPSMSTYCMTPPSQTLEEKTKVVFPKRQFEDEIKVQDVGELAEGLRRAIFIHCRNQHGRFVMNCCCRLGHFQCELRCRCRRYRFQLLYLSLSLSLSYLPFYFRKPTWKRNNLGHGGLPPLLPLSSSRTHTHHTHTQFQSEEENQARMQFALCLSKCSFKSTPNAPFRLRRKRSTSMKMPRQVEREIVHFEMICRWSQIPFWTTTTSFYVRRSHPTW